MLDTARCNSDNAEDITIRTGITYAEVGIRRVIPDDVSIIVYLTDNIVMDINKELRTF